ncbi:MAG: TauD/TfdA family dioxygenase [Gammaproteobacteria bacterium]|nr:TauD/TfdA family dioxygenase [Gammaproteobacteria bacterium]
MMRSSLRGFIDQSGIKSVVEIIAQSSTIGAEVRGLDISVGLSDQQFEQVNQAFLDYQIIFFRDQQLSPQQYNDFALRFGQLKDYLFVDGIDGFPFITEIVKTETETESFGNFWHSDSAYMELPPKITMLYARQIPAQGGDTLFADMYAAYDELSPGLKATLERLNAVNSASVVPRDEDFYAAVKSKNSDKRDQSAIHPVIRSHDETGKKSLYVNSIHTLGFEGMTLEESLPLLSYLYEQVTRPEYSFRLRWAENTLAMWDNRCTQHYALNDYHGHRRVMHRIIVEGEHPK